MQGSRHVDVGANVRGGHDLGAVVREVERRLAGVPLPAQASMSRCSARPTNVGAAQRRVLLYGTVAALVIFFLLQIALGSVRLALLLFLTLPMALVGGVLAARLIGEASSRSARSSAS